MEIKVKSILKTAPQHQPLLGLVTLQVEVPLFVWVELLTHKRFARNASSNRAMPLSKNVEMGYYEPAKFYEKGKGMSSGEELSYEKQFLVRQAYLAVWRYASNVVLSLEEIGVSKEQSSRLLPAIKMMKGVVTGNLRAWKSFLILRNNLLADIAMQNFAEQVRTVIFDNESDWINSETHLPFLQEGETFVNNNEMYKILGARIARVSYSSGAEKRIEEDLKLGERLIVDKHLSPFEHLAYYKINPYHSALYNNADSRFDLSGWENIRSEMENK